ncbi:MAG: hypothetical protein XD43_0930 [Thermococcales archaeon 44_46]|jgi:aspartokinase|uniref:ACT domain-containing protein n=1 Tax=Thermococcus TaxID=2263 RepID=UPI0005B2B24A|nr:MULTISPECIES: ACT domain-containing protein [Thermococcus]KUJ99401.1 MAG: hypothetical protein XD43_0930 [Thermococcales archaeon 44_46]MCA6214023.1 ACT domain-containing protein [Thermococcus bergensis]MDK2853869.1 hypothetical protein [Thermococcaceae archaeon]HIH71966.1 ACT domain-containing protein [Thermococcaceae archaeon]
MGAEKKSIMEIVREEIMRRPVIQECIRLGIVNYSALARLLIGELGLAFSVPAVKMALIRLGEELKGEKSVLESRVRKVIGGSIIELQSDVSVVTLPKEGVSGIMEKISAIMGESRFFQLTQGRETFTVVISSEDEEKVLSLARDVIEILREQTALTIVSPEGIISTPGVVAFMASALSLNGINITQVISCYKDTIFVIDRRDAPRAYQLLEELIRRMR